MEEPAPVVDPRQTLDHAIVAPGQLEPQAIDATVPGKEPVVAEDLSYGHGEFRYLQWLGFIADGNVDRAFYLDNVVLEKVEK